MPRRRMMTEKVDVIFRLRAGQPLRAIERETGVHRTIVRRLRKLAEASAWLSADRPPPDEAEVARVIAASRRRQPELPHPLDAYREDLQRWIKSGNSYVVIHQLVHPLCALSEATVRRYIQRTFPSTARPTMVRATTPGEIMEVDFGYLGISYQAKEKRNRKTYLFSGRLRYSRKAYRERVFCQDEENFFACHIHAFEYFGGVPHKVVPDNLKAAVIAASFEDPLVNRAYHDLARHYGFLISPCEPYSPPQKGGVESDVKYVKRNFWPLFCEAQRRLGREVVDADELSSELAQWSAEVADRHIVRGVGRSPEELFETEERSALQGLPAFRWDRVVCAQAKVQRTWRIQFDRAFYSVPHRYIGKTVQVLANSHALRIFCDHEQIAMHHRATRAWEYLCSPEHAPANVAAFMAATDPAILEQARAIAPAVFELVGVLLNRQGLDGLRPARAVLALRRRYGEQRLSDACRRALAYERAEYRCVKTILANGLDLHHPGAAPQLSDGQQLFRFARRPGYFESSQLKEAIDE